MENVLIEQIMSSPDIYKIYVPLPNNPLKNLNSYVLKTPEKNLIIDTGFNMPESKAALLEGLKKLDIDMKKTEIYATHVHSDHTGLIGEIMLPDTVIYMSERDSQILRQNLEDDGWAQAENRMMNNGFPLEEIEISRRTNPARAFAVGKIFAPKTVKDGDKIVVGPYTLTVVYVPGHTPGNTCLYMEEQKIMFTGDHILFDITPNITAWPGMEDALGDYLESLKKVCEFEIKLALPAHRKNDMDVYERIDALLAHHEARLQDTVDTLKRMGAASAYDIAAQLKWSMRGKDWTEFPVHQKWFAVGETLSHLDYLLLRGRAEKKLNEATNIIEYSAL